MSPNGGTVAVVRPTPLPLALLFRRVLLLVPFLLILFVLQFVLPMLLTTAFTTEAFDKR